MKLAHTLLSRKLLFTPGPLTVSDAVKEKMTQTLGSREPEFISLISDIHTQILKMADLDEDYCAIMMQGSGTYGVESVIQTIVPSGEQAKVLTITNGAYGNRVAKINEVLNLNQHVLRFEENEIVDSVKVAAVIEEIEPTHLMLVHCETSTGILNPVEDIGQLCTEKDIVYIVDGMSSFGGVDFNIQQCGIDFMITSANKCIQGVPGVSIVVAKKEKLVDFSRTLSQNITQQHLGFESNGQFRFTPPIECLLALKQALDELEEETIKGREKRYQNNFNVLRDGMCEMGFKTYLPEEISGWIINSFEYPEENFHFEQFYEMLLENNCYIYPGKVTEHEVFRIGTVGDLHQEDVEFLLKQIKDVSEKMNLEF